MIYERRFVITSLPFTELKRLSYINPKAQATSQDQDFSLLIRQGIPGISL
jgi:hypothetical protein